MLKNFFTMVSHVGSFAIGICMISMVVLIICVLIQDAINTWKDTND